MTLGLKKKEEKELTIEEELEALFKKVLETEKELFCPVCKKFTKFMHLKFYGKDKMGMRILTTKIKDIQEFIGYRYQCQECRTRIDSEKNLGEVEA